MKMRCANLVRGFLAGTAACILFFSTAGCMPPASPPPQKPVVQQLPVFPPEAVMKSGDYATFYTENENALKSCRDPEGCSIALFNLGFLLCYSKSPYYSPTKGVQYLEDLIKGSPESPWAYQATIWIDLLRKKIEAESRGRKLRREVKSKEAVIGELNKQIETTQQDNNPEADRERLEEEIRSREAIIRELNDQIDRLRQIDVEIEKKERKLPY